MSHPLHRLAACVLVMTCLSCGATDHPHDDPADTPILEPADPQPAGDRQLGIALSESVKGFGESFLVAQEAGIQFVELNIPWDAVETAPGRYQDPQGLLAAVRFYGDHDIHLFISLAVINTIDRTDPRHLRSRPFDDPAVIAGFNNMIDWLIANVPDNVTLTGISVGNEVDLYLNDKTWPQYLAFYQATRAHLRAQHPGLTVGCKTTVTQGLFNPNVLKNVQQLNRDSDTVMLNYYPQDHAFRVLPPEAVHEHFQQIADTYPGRDIWLTEVGYQSGDKHCNSSEAKQAEFFHELFIAWDRHRDQIDHIMINWLHDQSDAQIKEWTKYYGSDAPAFAEYLATLGLRHHDHTDKPAWRQLLAETRARGWGE